MNKTMLKRQFKSAILRLQQTRLVQYLYYKLFSNKFSTEHYKVLLGTTQAKLNLDTSFLLRRSIHRLEKGLTMMPRREIFAKEYINQTVEHYIALTNSECPDESLKKWAFNILTEYFNTVRHEGSILQAFDSFIKIQPGVKSESFIPFLRQDSPDSFISYNEIYQLALKRRSVRWYLPKKVPRNLIDKAILAASLSPSACNRQPFTYFVFDNKKSTEDLLSIVGGTAGWLHSPPVAIALIGHLDAFTNERDRHIPYIDASLSAMSFMFALETLGLASCAINFPDISSYHDKISSLLSLKPTDTTIMLIALGFPDPKALIPRSIKREVKYLVNYSNES